MLNGTSDNKNARVDSENVLLIWKLEGEGSHFSRHVVVYVIVHLTSVELNEVTDKNKI